MCSGDRRSAMSLFIGSCDSRAGVVRAAGQLPEFLPPGGDVSLGSPERCSPKIAIDHDENATERKEVWTAGRHAPCFAAVVHIGLMDIDTGSSFDVDGRLCAECCFQFWTHRSITFAAPPTSLPEFALVLSFAHYIDFPFEAKVR